jgi:hypothetical protein
MLVSLIDEKLLEPHPSTHAYPVGWHFASLGLRSGGFVRGLSGLSGVVKYL